MANPNQNTLYRACDDEEIEMLDWRNPLAVKLRKHMAADIARFEMIEPGDKIMVCVSGGKDSTILLALLAELQRRAPFRFELEGVLLDQKQPGFDDSAYRAWMASEVNAKFTVLEKDTYSIVKAKMTTGTYCFLCSRLRRGILYDYAHRNGFTKMALGHHRNDASETLLMNLFYTGKLQAMPPKFKSDDGRNVVIRPLITTAEEELKELSEAWKIPVIPCNLCGSQDGLKRKQVKKLITDLEKVNPGIRRSMQSAIENVCVSHLADDRVWDFRTLADGGESLVLPLADAQGLI